MQGTVIKSTGSWYQVRLDDTGEVLQCRIVGRFRLDGKKITNPVAVGDFVRVEREEEEGKAIIREILDRTNYVVRQSPRKQHFLHLLAANVDQAVILMTIVQPMLKQGFIDRFLLMTEPYEIPTTIVFNKADLYEEKDLAMYAYLEDIYTSIGYGTLLVSAETGYNLDKFKALLQGKTSLLSGQSGVGKSTLVNAIAPSRDLRTQELSDYSGKGQHTTTFAEMFDLPGGGHIIDTPGIKTLSFNNLKPIQVAHNFREFFALTDNCKFGGSCLHRDEPKCAVKEAVEAEELSELRYINYLTLLAEVEEQNYWERHQM